MLLFTIGQIVLWTTIWLLGVGLGWCVYNLTQITKVREPRFREEDVPDIKFKDFKEVSPGKYAYEYEGLRLVITEGVLSNPHYSVRVIEDGECIYEEKCEKKKEAITVLYLYLIDN